MNELGECMAVSEAEVVEGSGGEEDGFRSWAEPLLGDE